MSKIPESSEKDTLGLDLKPGDDHYRAYVGPSKDYDFIAAMSFNLLTCCGLRQHHKVLDVGCGSLRIGRLLIPYLNKGNYIGVEPNKWLVEDGINYELGETCTKLKSPTFIHKNILGSVKNITADFAIAQSIFSHTRLDLFYQWLRSISYSLVNNGALFATIVLGENDETLPEDYKDQGQWIYPACTTITEQTVKKYAALNGFSVQKLSYYHPRQTWFAFYKKDFDRKCIEKEPICWNNLKL